MLRPRHQPLHLGRRGHLHYRPFGGKAIPFEELNGYLAHPETIPETLDLYDRQYPGLFRWAGGLNLVKGALLPNHHEPASSADIAGWAPMMREFEKRSIPVTLARYPRLTLDLSWRVLEDQYFGKPGVRRMYADLLDAFPTRAILGTDFVASSDESYAVYKEELEVTSRINTALGDRAFRGIALGENYFRLLGLNATAPRICEQK